MEIIDVLPYDCTVQDLIDLLSQLPEDAVICPFGEVNCGICYDPTTNQAYLDSVNFLEEEFEIEF